MCGIAGWISFDQDLSARTDEIDAMTASLAPRGPDAAGIWTSPHAALGHRRLAVIDPAGGAQPMTVEQDGRTVLVLSYSGEVYNHQELRAQLQARGHHFRSRSDTEVVLRAFLEWGSAFVTRLNGMYAFALWDPRTEELLLVRDRLGIKPLYYQRTADGVLFGSEPKALLAHPAVEPVVDLDGLRELLGFTVTPGHAVYRGMRQVRPGHTVLVSRASLREQPYWQLEAREHTDDLPTTIGVVRELLEDTVARQLVADVPLSTLLSGGLDSSIITALAARHLGASQLRSFAVDFTHHTENFTPDPQRASPDAPFARALAAHAGTLHSEAVLDTVALTDPRHWDAVLRARDLPLGLGDSDTSLYLLFQEVRRHSTVALSGEAADELFGGYWWFHQPAVIAADTFPWIAAAQLFSPAGTPARESLLAPTLLRDLDLDGYRAARYREALRAVPHLAGESAAEHRMREFAHLHLTRSVPYLLDRKDRLSMAHGLEVRVPFCDHRLVEYAFNIPWSMKSFDGREKSILRAATTDLLPASISSRPKSPYPLTQDPAYAASLRQALESLLDHPTSPLHPLLNPEALRQATKPDTLAAHTRQPTELLLSLHTWLHHHQVHLDLR
ncbi:asparagine synthase (glutamine-hydrolyzing) [Kitasatospora sp. MAP12-15]|uniref:asparagine synthase (glutamine-hydrolyzing) n=1 Tax=unclassified Kitasatospora TaxID=2633591 RepID=UPI00247445CD|nr:asparagine synthase (glutamine-hydrolyzing) [Kitasatospora sp. MAP12-44]MDH6113397.1 asparagine synthase (glutamine-hydrolyzing) [Kitasatospora sp. MAP12-44]